MGPMNSAPVHCSQLTWSNSAVGTKRRRRRKRDLLKHGRAKCLIQTSIICPDLSWDYNSSWNRRNRSDPIGFGSIATFGNTIIGPAQKK